MKPAIQKRTLQTRARMVVAAETLVAENGFEALRVEEVVLKAGVAKGTFFAHFKDKDALMVLMIGARIDAFLDDIEKLPAPQSVDEIVRALMPTMQFAASERYVFDIIIRYSGASVVEEIGPIMNAFGRQDQVMSRWLAGGPFRKDVTPELLSDGVQAFLFQALALNFCQLHNHVLLSERLGTYLNAWLLPGAAQPIPS